MSVNISVSNKTQQNCEHIIKTMRELKINCRVIETRSIVDVNRETATATEKGCLLTFDKRYNTKKHVAYLWDAIKDDYACAHLKIDGLFDGCVNDYIYSNFCPK